ncbi:MAG: serine/threonine-protein kinase [Anaerolineae bacterium]
MEHFYGKVLNQRYILTDKVGQGGMATIYLAEDLHLKGAKVVIKQNILGNSPADWKLFHDEVGVLISLRNDASRPRNIPTIFDYQVDQEAGEQLQYLVMDYIPGEDLEKMVDRLGPLDQKIALFWTGQIMEALELLHKHSPRPIYHRDIKPSNIRVHARTAMAYLVDFGIAGSSNDILITDGYSPPEQYFGLQRADHRSDIYALGATLFALVTGLVPPASIERRDHGAALPESATLKASPELGAALVKALAIEPTQRYQSMAEMRQAFQLLIPASAPRLAGKQQPLDTLPTPLAHAPGLQPRLTASWLAEPPTVDTTQMRMTTQGQMITGHTSNRLRFWRIANWYQPGQLVGMGTHEESVNSLAITQEYRPRVVSGGNDWKIRLWDPQNGAPLCPPVNAHHGRVLALDVSKDGQLLASAGMDRTIRLWEISGGISAPEVLAQGITAQGLALSPNRSYLAAAGADGNIHVWNLQTRQKELLPADAGQPGKPLHAITFNPWGSLLVAAGEGGVVYLLDTNSWKRRVIGGPRYPGTIYDLVFSLDGRFLAGGGSNSIVAIWDAAQDQFLTAIGQLPDQAWSVAFGGQSNLLAIACKNGVVQLWQLA